eukprot:1280615-Rhodomonas_salina.1
MRGTEIGSAATRVGKGGKGGGRGVFASLHMLLRDARDCPSVCYYAMCGTEFAYGATWCVP